MKSFFKNVKTLQTVKSTAKLMRLHQPRGSLLLLFPTLTALVIATNGHIESWAFIFILGSIITRSLGCIINDICDQDIDHLVWRTQSRPLASGDLSNRHALVMAFILSAMALNLMLLLPYRSWPWCVLAFIGLAIYPLTKRFLKIPQLFLSVVFSMGIPIAMSINAQEFSMVCLLLFLSNFFWVFAYDSEYALADLIDDQKLPIYTSAKTLKSKTLPTIIASFGLSFVTMLAAGSILGFGHFFHLSLLISCLLSLVQIQLISQKKPELSLQAFLINPWIGFILLTGFTSPINPVL